MAQQAITGDMLVGQVMAQFPQAVDALYDQGMGCIGCPHAMMESLEMACAGHGVDADELVAKLNEYFAEK